MIRNIKNTHWFTHVNQNESSKVILEKLSLDTARVYQTTQRRRGHSEACIAVRFPGHMSEEFEYVFIQTDDSVSAVM